MFTPASAASALSPSEITRNCELRLYDTKTYHRSVDNMFARGTKDHREYAELVEYGLLKRYIAFCRAHGRPADAPTLARYEAIKEAREKVVHAVMSSLPNPVVNSAILRKCNDISQTVMPEAPSLAAVCTAKIAVRSAAKSVEIKNMLAPVKEWIVWIVCLLGLLVKETICSTANIILFFLWCTKELLFDQPHVYRGLKWTARMACNALYTTACKVYSLSRRFGCFVLRHLLCDRMTALLTLVVVSIFLLMAYFYVYGDQYVTLQTHTINTAPLPIHVDNETCPLPNASFFNATFTK